MLPTRAGVLFLLVVVVMLVGSVNYNNNLGIGFSFLLVGLALVSMLHTYRNLVGLQLRSKAGQAVFCGALATFNLQLSATKPPDRHAIALQIGPRPPVLHAVSATPDTNTTALLRVPAPRRGLLPLGRCRISTVYPLGLFRAWAWIRPGASCLVYPRPEEGPVPPIPLSAAAASMSQRGGSGREDFRGLRTYRPGDSPRHLAWKQAPLGPQPYTKQFEGDAGGEAWLDWDQIPGLGPEQRLSRLCRWVLDSHAAGHRYGLRLPGVHIPLGNGEGHKQRCLETLARFEIPQLRQGSTP